ncbi:hypothetical protein E1B28_007189 [Marasmius oreades]|uniref:Uncharacterized protein n=1 Tax=Marasmius oreades TaxID=181124 RepID=A0A9P7UTS7_9AGAR|nr:uncharacterized protein E1B28_007189 [Marasmius oreades]KAG7093515.1 hypothetical protein E1B28_007189 [Marasmius oreades]
MPRITTLATTPATTPSQSRAATVFEIEGEDEQLRDNFSHHLKMPGRPTKSCVADYPLFRHRESLTFTFFEMENPEHDDDGTKLVKCDMVCAFCLASKMPKPTTWKWNAEKGKGSTGNFNNHFGSRHHNVWTACTAEDTTARFPNWTQPQSEPEQSTLHSWSGSAFDIGLANRLKAEWIVT